MAPQGKKKFWKGKAKQGQQGGTDGGNSNNKSSSSSKQEMKFNTQTMGKSTTPFVIVKDHIIKQIQKGNWPSGYDVVVSLRKMKVPTNVRYGHTGIERLPWAN